MTLTISTAWEHDIVSAGSPNHLVITITATDTAPTQRAPIDLAFALDRSGSMAHQNKLGLVQNAVLASLNHLQPQDRVALVTFDQMVNTEHYLTPLDAQHRGHLERVTRALRAGGSTNLHGGWWEACHQLASAQGSGRIKRTLLLTDGLANVGMQHPTQLADQTRELYERGISTSAIGVGEGFDEMLLSAMAESGGGTFQYIADPRELDAFFEQELASLTSVVASQPYLEITLPHDVEAELINRFTVAHTRSGLGVTLRDLSASEQLTLVLRISPRHGAEHAPQLQPNLHIHWRNPETGSTEEMHESISAMTYGDPSRATRDENAAVAVALEYAARDQREAVQLDRNGRYQESRAASRAAYQRLQHMPATAEIREERERLGAMMNMPMAAMPEDVRKREVHRVHARSRGKQ